MTSPSLSLSPSPSPLSPLSPLWNRYNLQCLAEGEEDVEVGGVLEEDEEEVAYDDNGRVDR